MSPHAKCTTAMLEHLGGVPARAMSKARHYWQLVVALPRQLTTQKPSSDERFADLQVWKSPNLKDPTYGAYSVPLLACAMPSTAMMLAAHYPHMENINQNQPCRTTFSGHSIPWQLPDFKRPKSKYFLCSLNGHTWQQKTSASLGPAGIRVGDKRVNVAPGQVSTPWPGLNTMAIVINSTAAAATHMCRPHDVSSA